MALQTFVVVVRDNSVTPPGLRKPGLALTWVQLKQLIGGANVVSLPTFTDLGQGQYTFQYDAAVNGDAAGQVDATSALPNPIDRYIDVVLTDQGSMFSSGSLPLSPVTGTIGEALAVLRGLAVGRKLAVPNGTPPTLTVYSYDNSTPLFTITYNPSYDAPTTSISNR